jgi:hypothetical protein
MERKEVPYRYLLTTFLALQGGGYSESALEIIPPSILLEQTPKNMRKITKGRRGLMDNAEIIYSGVITSH